jgi:hypothetical protein
MRPPIVRAVSPTTLQQGPAPRSPAPPPTSSPKRHVRPIPERTRPNRSAERLLRADAPGASSPPRDGGDTDVARAVTEAYQVFDAYLREGREVAAGHSAWDNRPPAPSPGFDLVGAALWVLEQLGRAAPRITDARSTSPPPSWPAPRWPSTRAFHPQSLSHYEARNRSGAADPGAPERQWVPWDFGADAPAATGNERLRREEEPTENHPLSVLDAGRPRFP